MENQSKKPLPCISGSRFKLAPKSQDSLSVPEPTTRLSSASGQNPSKRSGLRKSSESQCLKSNNSVNPRSSNRISPIPTASLPPTSSSSSAAPSSSTQTNTKISPRFQGSKINDYFATSSHEYDPEKYEDKGETANTILTEEGPPTYPKQTEQMKQLVDDLDDNFLQIQALGGRLDRSLSPALEQVSDRSTSRARRLINMPYRVSVPSIQARSEHVGNLSVGGSSLQPQPQYQEPLSSASSRHHRANENGVEGLLERLRLSSVDDQVSGPPPPSTRGLQYVPGMMASETEEIEDGELWYQTVFGRPEFNESRFQLLGSQSLDDETPVQRLLRRYNAGISGFDSGMIRRFMGMDGLDDAVDSTEGNEVLQTMESTQEQESPETLTQHLLRLSEQAMRENTDFDVDTDDEFADHGVSLSLIESILAISQNISTPVEPVGTSEYEVNRIPIQIISSTRNMESCCPICLVDFAMGDSAMEFPGCTHSYHQTCLMEWLKVSRKCPTCRQELKQEM
ncbi:hypothetical protein BDR26DRAFT_869451, partial [Obelidium mucronatum]